MSSVSDISRFAFESNSIFTNKYISANKSDLKQTIKELTDPQRKKLLDIIQNPLVAEDNDTVDLADAIKKTQAALKDGTFQTRREVGCWKRICRAFSNIFKGRTSSKDVIKSIKKMEDSSFSAKSLTSRNKNLKNLYKEPETLNDTDVNGLLRFEESTRYLNPTTTKAYTGEFNHADDRPIDPMTVAIAVEGCLSVAQDARVNDAQVNRVHPDRFDYLPLDTGFCTALTYGWGGQAAMNYVEKNLINEIGKNLSAIATPSDADIYNTLNHAFHTCNKNWLISQERLSNEAEALSGASACVALMIDGHLWIANVGNTRAILMNDATSQTLTNDANPIQCKSKIVANGGTVNANGCVEGEEWDPSTNSWKDSQGLGVATAFGCFHIKGVTATPQITKVFPGPNTQVIIGTSGLFGLATTQEVVDYVRTCDPSEDPAAKLTQRVIEGYADDLLNAPSSTVIIISPKT